MDVESLSQNSGRSRGSSFNPYIENGQEVLLVSSEGSVVEVEQVMGSK